MKWKQTKTVIALLVIPFLLILCSGPEDYVENCADSTFSDILQTEITKTKNDISSEQDRIKQWNESILRLEDPNFSLANHLTQTDPCDINDDTKVFSAPCLKLPNPCADDEIRDYETGTCLSSVEEEFIFQKIWSIETNILSHEYRINDYEDQLAKLSSISEFVSKSKLNEKLLNKGDEITNNYTDYETIFELCSKQYGADKITFESKWQ